MWLLKQPHPNTEYRLEAIDDELLLFHPGKTTIMYCNPTASLVWQLCDGQRTIQEIISILERAYPDGQNLVSDVEGALQQFAQHGALELIKKGKDQILIV